MPLPIPNRQRLFACKDNRAFCKCLCPITVFLKPMSYFSSIIGKGGSTFCCRPLITHQQGQSGLSTVGVAHSLAVDWLGWGCYV